MDLIEPPIVASGHKYDKLADDAFLIYDFLTPDELSAFRDLAENAMPPQWYFFYLKQLEQQAETFYGRKDIATLIEEGKLMLIPRNMSQTLPTEPALGDMVEEVTNRVNTVLLPPDYPSTRYGVIQRHYRGIGLEDHRDTDCNPALKYATVIYLNDNYEGGNLYFKDDDLQTQLKPPPGSIMIFRASRLHGVTEVTGEHDRYVMTSFISHVDSMTDRFDNVADPSNPTEGEVKGYKQETDAALDHFLESGYGGSGKKSI